MLVVISKMETTADDMIKGRVNQFDLHVLYRYWNLYNLLFYILIYLLGKFPFTICYKGV